MPNEKEWFNKHLKYYITQANTVVHETKHKERPLYIVHQYQPKEENPTCIRSGCVYLIYAKPGRDTSKTFQIHDTERPVIEYRLVNMANGEDYVELITLKLDEDFRGFGLGKVLIKYFESKIIRKYYKDIQFIKGFVLIGDRDLKIFLHKNGYMIRDNQFSKKMAAPQIKTDKESLLYKYINNLLRQS